MDGNPDFLFTSMNHFFECSMWRGSSQHRGTHKLRKWFQWVYVAAFNGTDAGGNKLENHCQNLRFKIGKAQNLRVRGKALIVESGGKIIGGQTEALGEGDIDDDEEEEEEELATASPESTKLIKWSKEIVYAFSVPRPLMFETRIKRFLYNFIYKNMYKDIEGNEEKVQFASEIVQGISFEALIHVIQLCILEGCLYHKYIELNHQEQIFRQYVGDIMQYPPDTIEWDGNTYYGRKRGYHQIMVLKIDKSVYKTVQSTLANSVVNQRMDQIQVKGEFDLMKDVITVNPKPKFVQYVFNVEHNDSRLNYGNNPSTGPSKMSFSTNKDDAPNKSFVIGNLAFAIYEKDSDGGFPCEIVGYWNGQFVIRWIDPRRFDTKARKWIVYDSVAHRLYKNKDTRNRLSDFLKDDVVAVGNKYLNNPVANYRYRDYIQLLGSAEKETDVQPTDVLVPTFYRNVAEEYKDPNQLKTWNAMKYGAKYAPSRHWYTGNPTVINKPTNPIFQNKEKTELDQLEIKKELDQLEEEEKKNQLEEEEEDEEDEEEEETEEDDDLDGLKTLKDLKDAVGNLDLKAAGYKAKSKYTALDKAELREAIRAARKKEEETDKAVKGRGGGRRG